MIEYNETREKCSIEVKESFALLTCWNEQSVSLFDRALVTHVNLVSKKHLVLIGRGIPALKERQVGWCGGY